MPKRKLREYCRQPFPYRIMEGLPVIRAQYQGDSRLRRLRVDYQAWRSASIWWGPIKGPPSSHLLGAFRDELGINLPRVIVGCLGVGEFCLGNFRNLLSPALVYRGKAPLGALTRCANRFSVHQ